MNTLKADIIRIIHICIILYILLTPFIVTDESLLTIHVFCCIALLSHWYFNSDECILTLLESKLRGISTEESFINNIISPIYKTSYDFTTILTIILMIISFYKIIKNKLS